MSGQGAATIPPGCDAQAAHNLTARRIGSVRHKGLLRHESAMDRRVPDRGMRVVCDLAKAMASRINEMR